MNNPGKLIALEGIDGCGKTTLAQSLGEALTHQGYAVLVTKQPGGTEFGKKVRALIEDTSNKPISLAQYLLFAADRAEHVERVIRPAIAAGTIVIADRLTDSSIAYQGYGYGVDRAIIDAVNGWTMGGLTPDCTFYLRVTPAVAAARITARGAPKTSFEREGGAYVKRVIQGFEAQCTANNHCSILDGAQEPDQVLKQALAQLAHIL